MAVSIKAGVLVHITYDEAKSRFRYILLGDDGRVLPVADPGITPLALNAQCGVGDFVVAVGKARSSLIWPAFSPAITFDPLSKRELRVTRFSSLDANELRALLQWDRSTFSKKNLGWHFYPKGEWDRRSQGPGLLGDESCALRIINFCPLLLQPTLVHNLVMGIRYEVREVRAEVLSPGQCSCGGLVAEYTFVGIGAALELQQMRCVACNSPLVAPPNLKRVSATGAAVGETYVVQAKLPLVTNPVAVPFLARVEVPLAPEVLERVRGFNHYVHPAPLYPEEIVVAKPEEIAAILHEGYGPLPYNRSRITVDGNCLVATDASVQGALDTYMADSPEEVRIPLSDLSRLPAGVKQLITRPDHPGNLYVYRVRGNHLVTVKGQGHYLAGPEALSNLCDFAQPLGPLPVAAFDIETQPRPGWGFISPQETYIPIAAEHLFQAIQNLIGPDYPLPAATTFELQPNYAIKICYPSRELGMTDPLYAVWPQTCLLKDLHFEETGCGWEVVSRREGRAGNYKYVPSFYRRGAEAPITLISVVHSGGLRRIFVCERELGLQHPSNYQPAGFEVVFCTTEAELLERAATFLGTLKGVVLSFNGDGFDIAYMVARIKRYQNARPEFCQNIFYYGVGGWEIKGCLHFDLMRYFKIPAVQAYVYQDAYEGFSLEAISQALLGRGKAGGGKAFAELGFGEWLEYCVTDSTLLLDLWSHRDYQLPKLVAIFMRITGLPIGQIARGHINQWIMNRFILFHLRRNQCLHPPWVYASERVENEGADVPFFVGGAMHNIDPMDFESEYQTVADNLNFSYETIFPLGTKCNVPGCNQLNHFPIPERQIYACQSQPGIMPQVIGELKAYRLIIFKPLGAGDSAFAAFSKAVSDVLKVFINAAYGVFGDQYFDLYCPPVPDAIASTSRFLIRSLHAYAIREHLPMSQGDTDSAFFFNLTDDERAKLVEFSATQLFGLSLEAEKRIALLLSFKSKNYWGFYADHRKAPKIKGTFAIRGDTARFISAFMNRAIDYIRTEDLTSVEAIEGNLVKQLIRTYCETAESVIKTAHGEEGGLALEDFVISKRIGKYMAAFSSKGCPEHIRAALRYNSKVREIARSNPNASHAGLNKGDRISYLKTNRGPEPIETIGPEWRGSLNYHKYLDMLTKTATSILNLFAQITYREGNEIHSDPLVFDLGRIPIARPWNGQIQTNTFDAWQQIWQGSLSIQVTELFAVSDETAGEDGEWVDAEGDDEGETD